MNQRIYEYKAFNDKFYIGTVQSYDFDNECYKVIYKDGDEEDICQRMKLNAAF